MNFYAWVLCDDLRSFQSVLSGGIDPHTHLEMPFMGQEACDDFYSGQVCSADPVVFCGFFSSRPKDSARAMVEAAKCAEKSQSCLRCISVAGMKWAH